MKAVVSLFPKFLAGLDADGLAEAVARVGLNTVNVVIRDGYWVTRAGLAEELPRFLATMRRHGIASTFATACFEFDDMLADDRPIAILAEHGIRQFRTGQFKESGRGIRRDIDDARRSLAALEAICRRRGIQAVYQLHHGTLVPSPSMAWHLVQGLDYRFIGVEPDAGNQGFEGFEEWGRSARLLNEYCCALGVKDTAPKRDPARAGEPGKGWTRGWVSCAEGVTDWGAVFRALAAIDFAGTLVLQPFYHNTDREAHVLTLTAEVAYLQATLKAAVG